jgi:hypothetical protein
MYKKFDFMDSPQTFTAPFKGNYVFELWGAGGGNSQNGLSDTTFTSNAGKGGYLKASKALDKNYTLYVYTGKRGNNGGAATTSSGGAAGPAVWGGGGAGGKGHAYNDASAFGGGASGGGATFISTTSHASGITDSATHNAGVLFAGGGGGSCRGPTNFPLPGGHGTGGDSAGDGVTSDKVTIYGASSSKGITTGIGKEGKDGGGYTRGDHGCGGGGGGYKGGEAQTNSGVDSDASGGGGNGYVASGYTAMTRLRGDESMPNSSDSPSDSGTMTGNTVNGAVRISYVP